MKRIIYKLVLDEKLLGIYGTQSEAVSSAECYFEAFGILPTITKVIKVK